MEIKTSSYTIYLVIGLVIVTIARYFFSPLEQTELWKMFDAWFFLEKESPNEFLRLIAWGMFYLCCPVVMSFAESFPYFALIFGEGIEGNSFAAQMVIGCLICFCYIVLLNLLEQFHSYLHEKESLFTICVDMLCLENIVMYIATLLFYFILTFVPNLNIPEFVWVILFFPVILIAAWLAGCYLAYLAVGVFISMGIPALIFLLFDSLVPIQVLRSLYDFLGPSLYDL